MGRKVDSQGTKDDSVDKGPLRNSQSLLKALKRKKVSVTLSCRTDRTAN